MLGTAQQLLEGVLHHAPCLQQARVLHACVLHGLGQHDAALSVMEGLVGAVMGGEGGERSMCFLVAADMMLQMGGVEDMVSAVEGLCICTHIYTSSHPHLAQKHKQSIISPSVTTKATSLLNQALASNFHIRNTHAFQLATARVRVAQGHVQEAVDMLEQMMVKQGGVGGVGAGGGESQAARYTMLGDVSV